MKKETKELNGLKTVGIHKQIFGFQGEIKMIITILAFIGVPISIICAVIISSVMAIDD